MFTEQRLRSLLSFSKETGHLLINRALRLLGIRSAGEGVRSIRSISDRPHLDREPPWRTIRVAISVAPARSFEAPVEGSPSTSISAARPPSRMARESVR